MFDVERLLAGAPGSSVTLRLRHPTETDARTLTIVRGPVSLRTVRGFARAENGAWRYLIDPVHRIGYIRISNFLESTTRDFDIALGELLDERVRGLILDVRFNPGGVLHEAVDLVDRFVDDGIILTTVTRHRAVQTYHATQRATTIGIPLVLLINGASASAAEIVAGSLQSHGRATIIGRRSFGKGSVQHLIQLKEHPAAVRLTTAYYRLPDGRVIHRTKANAHGNAWGILPDIEVILNNDEAHAIQQSRSALDVAFSNMPFSPNDSVSDTPPQRLEILRDRQLLEALSHLRERG